MGETGESGRNLALNGLVVCLLYPMYSRTILRRNFGDGSDLRSGLKMGDFPGQRGSIFVTHNVVLLRYSYGSIRLRRLFSTLALGGWPNAKIGL